MVPLVAVGLGGRRICLLDAYDGSTKCYGTQTFVRVWNRFTQMAVVVKGPLSATTTTLPDSPLYADD
jgi:hypothetical protein